VSAANFEHALTAGEHLGDKLVAREREEHVPRIVVPSPRGGNSQTLDPSLANEVHSLVVVSLAGPGRCRNFCHVFPPDHTPPKTPSVGAEFSPGRPQRRHYPERPSSRQHRRRRWCSARSSSPAESWHWRRSSPVR